MLSTILILALLVLGERYSYYSHLQMGKLKQRTCLASRHMACKGRAEIQTQSGSRVNVINDYTII